MEISVFKVKLVLLRGERTFFGYRLGNMRVAMKAQNMDMLVADINAEIAIISKKVGERPEIVLRRNKTRVTPTSLPQEYHYPLSRKERREFWKLFKMASN